MIIDETFALELETYRRCFPAQPVLSALQGRKCTHLLRDLATTADLPPNSALFSQQLLDLTHRSSEREDNDMDIGDVHLLAAAVYIHVKLRSARYPRSGSTPIPRPSAACSPTGRFFCPQSLLHSSPCPSSTTLHCCTQLGTIQEVVTEEYRILGSVKLRAWHPLASSMDPSLQAAPLLVVSAALSAVSAPAPFTDSSRRACSGCSRYC